MLIHRGLKLPLLSWKELLSLRAVLIHRGLKQDLTACHFPKRLRAVLIHRGLKPEQDDEEVQGV